MPTLKPVKPARPYTMHNAPSQALTSTPPSRWVPRFALIALASAMLLQGCNKTSDEQTPAPTVASAAVPVAPAPVAAPTPAAAPAVPYQRLSAEQLYQMVAPIALFPDRLLAQVLAGATHPDQIQAAAAWRAQQGGDLATIQNAADQQPWDVSVKALTAFPDVLNQMAQNLPWTTALGQAYANDSTDVMNAIQVLRQRATRNGHLKSTPEWTVSSTTYSGPADTDGVIPPPPDYIEIAPPATGVVYVPHYDPTVVYGDAVPLYPGYQVIDSGPVYRNPNDPLVTGLVAFGAGVAIAAVLDHHDWGWNAWGMDWGHHGDRRPSVEYDHNVYNVTRTTNVNTINNTFPGGRGPGQDERGNAGNGLNANRPGPGTPSVPRFENGQTGAAPGMTVPQFRSQDTRPTGGPVHEEARPNVHEGPAATMPNGPTAGPGRTNEPREGERSSGDDRHGPGGLGEPGREQPSGGNPGANRAAPGREANQPVPQREPLNRNEARQGGPGALMENRPQPPVQREEPARVAPVEAPRAPTVDVPRPQVESPAVPHQEAPSRPTSPAVAQPPVQHEPPRMSAPERPTAPSHNEAQAQHPDTGHEEHGGGGDRGNSNDHDPHR